MDKIQKNIGFIGGGQMGTALIGGFLGADLFDAGQIYVMDILQSKLDTLSANYGCYRSGEIKDGRSRKKG